MRSRQLIEGICITPLKQITDARGAVFHVIKKSNPVMQEFGEVYISKVNREVIKAWKYHKDMIQNFSVPYGKLKLVVYDNREKSITKGVYNEFFLDPISNYNLITIPNQLWYGFQCIDLEYCLLLNVTNMEHDPKESETLDINNELIQYKW